MDGSKSHVGTVSVFLEKGEEITSYLLLILK